MAAAAGADPTGSGTRSLKSLIQTLGVGKEPGGLLYRAALKRPMGDLCSVLALVGVREEHPRYFHQLLHSR